MATSDDKVDMSLDDIIKLEKKNKGGRGGGRLGRGGGQGSRGGGQGTYGGRGGGRRGRRGGQNRQDGLRGTRGGGVQKQKGRGGVNFRGMKNRGGFQRQLSGVSPLNRNPKKNSGQQQQGQNQNWQRQRNNSQQNYQQKQRGSNRQNYQQRQNQQNFQQNRRQNQPQQQISFYGHDNRNNQQNQFQRQNFQRSRGQGQRGGMRRNNTGFNRNTNFGINNNKRLSLSQKKSQALKALKQARKTLQNINKQQQTGGIIQIGSKRRNSLNTSLQSDQPPVKKRKQWRQPSELSDGILTVNVNNMTTSSGRPNAKQRRKLKRLGETSLRQQIKLLKPSQTVTYQMEKTLFAQPSTSLSLSERFKQEGRKVFF